MLQLGSFHYAVSIIADGKNVKPGQVGDDIRPCPSTVRELPSPLFNDKGGYCDPPLERRQLGATPNLTFILNHGLSGCQTSDGNTVRRATDIIEAVAVAKLHRLRIPTMFTANTDFE